MKKLMARDARLGAFVAQAIGRPVQDLEHSLGLVDLDAGAIVAATIYEDCTGRGGSVTMHTAAQGAVTRRYLWAVFDYPYNVLQVAKVVAPVNSANTHSLDITERLGFSVEAVVKGYYPNGDLIITSMSRQDCRWLGTRERPNGTVQAGPA